LTVKICSLFSGIGGFDLGFELAGFQTTLICESDPAAQAVLKKHFPRARRKLDVVTMKTLPRCEIVTAGWPCQDLSQAGRMAGINGRQSSLVNHVFRLIDASRYKPQFVIFENVAFALHLHGGQAINQVINQLENSGYNWVYRILDTQEFGLPHRRRRIFIAGTREGDPTSILFDGQRKFVDGREAKQIGFYWTEGNRGIGWSPEAVPPLKGGSGLSIPSPPAIWCRKGRTFFSPGIEDAERLQGFKKGWTLPASLTGATDRVRWRLVGNAVSVPVARWIAQRIAAYERGNLRSIDVPIHQGRRGHNMAWGGPGLQRGTTRLEMEGPARSKRFPISEFALNDAKPLSVRAASGFLERLQESTLIVDQDFVKDLTRYCNNINITASKAS
jgi:DNA (cytosine-5)-methyltransferase 1